jgi:glyoxylase-like metal-dependent hydrolase (beta-lactamase superfamily II)
MAAKPFASSADLAAKEQTLEVLADGVYALTAEGDPNIGAVEGEDFLVCFEALATPVVAARWLAKLREHTDKPVRYLVLSHYHAVRVLGASAFDAEVIVAHENTRALVAERGEQDWASEFARMPRLAEGADSVPGLTWPTLTFSDRLAIDLGGDRGDLVLQYCGRGHTEGDITAWLPRHRILFAGDLVEAEAALYTGDAFHRDWTGATLDRVPALGATSWSAGAAREPRPCAVTRRSPRPRIPAPCSARSVRCTSAGDASRRSHATHAASTSRVADLRALPPFDVPAVGRARRRRAPGIWTADATARSGRAAGAPDGDRRRRVSGGPVGQTTALLLAAGACPSSARPPPERDLVGSKAICQQRDVLDVWEDGRAGGGWPRRASPGRRRAPSTAT